MARNLTQNFFLWQFSDGDIIQSLWKWKGRGEKAKLVPRCRVPALALHHNRGLNRCSSPRGDVSLYTITHVKRTNRMCWPSSRIRQHRCRIGGTTWKLHVLKLFDADGGGRVGEQHATTVSFVFRNMMTSIYPRPRNKTACNIIRLGSDDSHV